MEASTTTQEDNINPYVNIQSRIMSEKDENYQLVIMAEYFLENYNILTNWNTKDIYIYKDGIFRSNGEIFLLQEIQNIAPAWKRTNKKEVIDKIMTTTYFEVNPFNKKDIVVVMNGVIDLNKLFNKEPFFFDFSPDYLSTKQLPIWYDKTAMCPTIDNFFIDVGSYLDDNVSMGPYEKKYQENFTTYLLQILADILTNHYTSQVLHLFLGGGNNGKGTFIRLIEAFVGKKNRTTLGLPLLYEDGFHVYELEDSMVNLCGDISDQWVKDSGLLKKVTGEDSFSTDVKNARKSVDVKNTAKMIFSGQFVPKTNEDSVGWFRRFLISEWKLHIDKDKKDATLEKRMHTDNELSGLLNKVLTEYITFRKNNYKYILHNTVDENEIRRSHLLKSNPVKIFSEEVITNGDDDDFLPKRELYFIYDRWRLQEKALHKTEKAFHIDLKREFGQIPSKRHDAKRCYEEIRLTIKGEEIQTLLKKEKPEKTPKDIATEIAENEKNRIKNTYNDLLRELRVIFYSNKNTLSISDIQNNLTEDSYFFNNGKELTDLIYQMLQNGDVYEKPSHYFGLQTL